VASRLPGQGQGQNQIGMKRLWLFALACLLTTGWLYEDGDSVATVSLGQVTVTCYQAVPEQTDGAPHITADGTDLRETDERICALSRDLLWRWGGPAQWGDLVWLYIPRHPELSGPWTVRDTMAETIFRNGEEVPLVRHVDLLTDTIGRWSSYALLIGEEQ